MPKYSVVIHGQGFRFAGVDGLPLRSFEVTRVVDADSADAAAEAALARVAREWVEGEFASTGVRPQIQAAAITTLDDNARTPDLGYHFQH